MTRAVPSEHPPEQRSAPGPGRLARWLPVPGPVGPPAAAGPGERRAWRIVGVLVLACVLLLGAGATGAFLVQQETTQERTYFEPVGQLDIDAGPAQVTVRSGATDRVVVSERIGWALRKPTVAERIDAGTMSLSVGCPEARVLQGCPVSLEIQVPPTTTVHARNGSGRTEVVGLSGSVSAETGSGQIQLTGVSGPVWARSGSGQITGTGLSASRAQLSSSSGDVTLQYDRPPDEVTTRLASGNLVLQLPDDHSRYRIDLSLDGGHRAVDQSLQDVDSPRLLDVTSASGTVTIGRAGAS
ncbi:DUF4097 family beta strand repeat-containing protein [Kitasatospora phosalacinea]|uniref:DUF4097 domain-containing protein n=1 Tax=Kitasatospora phosalacinea TaxID=2065 RepID=A0A9W6UME0_9ACTN|nr:DUF4097 family beta strand repeat-containing protein [Kitasatospora phosalacinea]GLW53113.1 hypothetical protein Kpho01_11240 [Kitasatospora phosalacinea]